MNTHIFNLIYTRQRIGSLSLGLTSVSIQTSKSNGSNVAETVDFK